MRATTAFRAQSEHKSTTVIPSEVRRQPNAVERPCVLQVALSGPGELSRSHPSPQFICQIRKFK
jgi:hypothetical protein